MPLNAPRKAAERIRELSFLLQRTPLIPQIWSHFRRRGVAIVGEPFDLEAIGRRLAFFADPWGNLIELAEILASPSK
jgi:hypothetical protein